MFKTKTFKDRNHYIWSQNFELLVNPLDLFVDLVDGALVAIVDELGRVVDRTEMFEFLRNLGIR